MDLIKSLIKDIYRWEAIEEIAYIDEVDKEKKPDTVQSLQRSFYPLYGNHPKMEDRLYSSCKMCGNLFNPLAIKNHKNYCINNVQDSCTKSLACSLYNKNQLNNSLFNDNNKDVLKIIPDDRGSKQDIIDDIENDDEPILFQQHSDSKPTFFQIIQDYTTASEIQQTADVSSDTSYPDPSTFDNVAASNIEKMEESGAISLFEFLLPIDNYKNSGESLINYLFNPVVKKENNIYVDLMPKLDDNPRSTFRKRPLPDDQLESKQLYKVHPKTRSQLNYNAKRIGGSIICSNHRCNFQRGEIINSIDTRHNSALDNNIIKVNYKRPSTDNRFNNSNSNSNNNNNTTNNNNNNNNSTNNNNNKHIKLSQEMNGYLSQNDVNDVADVSPDSTHCIEQNFNLFNFK